MSDEKLHGNLPKWRGISRNLLSLFASVFHPALMPRLVFTFVRHGETKNNRERVLAGHLDTPLNSFGRRQAAAVALSPRLKETQFEYAFGSDLSRAVEVSEGGYESNRRLTTHYIIAVHSRQQKLSWNIIPRSLWSPPSVSVRG